MYWLVELVNNDGLIDASVVVRAGNENGAAAAAYPLFARKGYSSGQMSVMSIDDVEGVVAIVRHPMSRYN